ncbi:hypothetical protein J4217_04985 [Candidatus Pacearchaeota archaeon]|nr:hypothetical protein [Candidatus Pacearchaeota archaeon]
MERKQYTLTLVPIPADGKVIFRKQEYTTAAKSPRNSLVINGQRYYIRRNGDVGITELEEAVFSATEKILLQRKIDSPIDITLTIEENKVL